MELAEELKMASALSLPPLESSASPAGDTELCSVFHPEREADAGTIQLWGGGCLKHPEWDIEHSPPLCLTYEELLEVVAHVVEIIKDQLAI